MPKITIARHDFLQDRQGLGHDGVRLAALDVDDEADAAGVVLMLGVVQSLCWEHRSYFPLTQ